MLKKLRSRVMRAIFLNALPEELLDPDIDRETAKRLFKTFVDIIEIETHSYCNRVCSFCPNAYIDRRSNNHLLSGTSMEKICANLREISYSGQIMFSGYNEPFFGGSIFDWAKALKEAAPDCKLFVITNGDYLTREVLEKADEVGIGRITVDLYPAAGKEDDPVEHARITRLFETRSKLALRRTHGGFMEGEVGDVSVGVRVCNYKPVDLQTRGGLVAVAGKEAYVRHAPCFFPINQVTINHTGDGMLCCQVRSDVKEHRSSIFANLNDDGEDLFTYYRALGRARRHLATGAEKRGVCRNCDYLDSTPVWAGRKRGLSMLSRLAPGATMARMLESRRKSRRAQFH